MTFKDDIRLRILGLPKSTKVVLVVLLDSLLVFLSVWLAFYLRLGEFLPMWSRTAEHFPLVAAATSLLLLQIIFWSLKVYQSVLRFSDFASLSVLAVAIASFSGAYFTVITLIGVPGVPRTIGLIQPVLLLILLCFSRILIGRILDGSRKEGSSSNARKEVLIYGAGRAGREMRSLINTLDGIVALGFIDDNPALHGRRVSGLPVFSPLDIGTFPGLTGIEEILLALPKVGRRRRRQIVGQMERLGVSVRSLPSYNEIVSKRVTFSEIRDLSIDEILGREPVAASSKLLDQDIKDKNVMVTGAGGSIGGELCRQILNHNPTCLILFEQNEFALFNINNELNKAKEAAKNVRCEILPVLGSIDDKRLVHDILGTKKVDTIYHAAAHKHVHLVELNPLEGLYNNVIGSLTVADAACQFGVDKFVLISTDKAVRPTSIMGASKRIAEMALQLMSLEHRSTKFAMVRFGNVLGSSGSVVPLFLEQIKNGGPVTITHPDVTRYFMTISEAAQLVIQAGAMTDYAPVDQSDYEAAPVYLLDMGEPVKIIRLAEKMIKLSGLTVFDQTSNPDGDIEIKTIGLRSGEKLFEELLIGDNVMKTENPKIHVAREEFLSPEELRPLLDWIKGCKASGDVGELKTRLGSNFPDLFQNEPH